MKFAIKLTFIIIFVSLLVLIEYWLKRLQKKIKKIKDPICSKIYFKNATQLMNIDRNNIFPQETQLSKEILEKAVTQLLVSRKFFYQPNTVAKNVLANIAANFNKFIKKKSAMNGIIKYSIIKDTVFKEPMDERTWDYWRDLFFVILDDTIESPTYSNTLKIAQQKKAYFKLIANNVENGEGSPRDILVFLATVGDIGTCISHAFGKMRTNEIQGLVAYEAVEFFGNIQSKTNKYYNKYSTNVYYDKVDPIKLGGKKKEKATCSKDGLKLEPNLTPRTGIFNLGNQVDAALNVDDDRKLPKIGWPWQTIPKGLIESCPSEPWTGHMASSLYEIFIMLELFNRSNVEIEEKVDIKMKKIYAALGSAFLLSTGMHTAVELTYVVKNYLGIRIDQNEVLSSKVCIGASKYIIDLINDEIIFEP